MREFKKSGGLEGGIMMQLMFVQIDDLFVFLTDWVIGGIIVRGVLSLLENVHIKVFGE